MAAKLSQALFWRLNSFSSSQHQGDRCSHPQCTAWSTWRPSLQGHGQRAGKLWLFQSQCWILSEPHLKTFHFAYFHPASVQWESSGKGGFFSVLQIETLDKKFAYESLQVHWWAHLAHLSHTPQPCNLTSTRTPWDPEPTKAACPHRPNAPFLRPSLPSPSTEHLPPPLPPAGSFAISSLLLCPSFLLTSLLTLLPQICSRHFGEMIDGCCSKLLSFAVFFIFPHSNR